MSCFISSDDWLALKCDGCRMVVKMYKGETDMTLKHLYMSDNGWKTHKLNNRWVDYCPECEAYYRQKNREKYFCTENRKKTYNNAVRRKK